MIHYVGAALMFGIGTIYCCITTWIGWHIAKLHSDRWLVVITGIRIGMCLLMLAGIITGGWCVHVFTACLTGNISTVFTATYVADSRYDKLSSNFSKFEWNPSDEVRFGFMLVF